MSLARALESTLKTLDPKERLVTLMLRYAHLLGFNILGLLRIPLVTLAFYRDNSTTNTQVYGYISISEDSAKVPKSRRRLTDVWTNYLDQPKLERSLKVFQVFL